MAGVAASAVAVVAGSGVDLGPLLDERFVTIPFSAFPGLAPCTVPGHQGRFVRGRCGDTPLILQVGRLHVYEGLSIAEVGCAVDALHELGARTVLFTNAAGGLLPDLTPGDLMAVRQIALWPYCRWNQPPSSIRPSLVFPGCAVEGAYVWVHGPSYETPAEIRAMRAMGYAAVGMSTAPEMLRAHELGIRTAAISCITNNCTVPQRLTHQHVVAIAAQASESLCAHIRQCLLNADDAELA